METRANYILIGAFTIAGLLATFGFLLWLANAEVNRQYTYYDMLFESVSGLGTASDVRFNGLPVGQVVALDLDVEDQLNAELKNWLAFAKQKLQSIVLIHALASNMQHLSKIVWYFYSKAVRQKKA